MTKLMVAGSTIGSLSSDTQGSTTGGVTATAGPASGEYHNTANHREPDVAFERISCYIELPVTIPYGSVVLRAKGNFVVSIWREEEFFCAEDTIGLGISEAAKTYDELRASINDTLSVLWDEYAMADDSELSEGAIDTKRFMRAHFHASKG